MADITIGIGASQVLQATTRNNGVALTGVFSSSDAVSAEVFAGDGQPVLFNPAATWISASAGTIKVTITAAQVATAGITPGEYLLRIFVTPVSDGQPRMVALKSIEFTPAPGSDTAPTAYATYRDLGAYTPEIDRLQSQLEDLSQFARQRHVARTETDNRILDAYRPTPGRTRRMYDADRTASGPYGPYYLTEADRADPDFTPPTAAEVKAALAAGGLQLNADIVEFNARYAAALVYGAQPGANNPYQQLGQQERALAERAWSRATVEIDMDADGTADMRLGRDVTWLV